MVPSSPSSQSFWILAGNVPVGPFDVREVHAQLASGSFNWQMLACPLGGSTWLPLLQIPGVGPTLAAPVLDSAIQAVIPSHQNAPETQKRQLDSTPPQLKTEAEFEAQQPLRPIESMSIRLPQAVTKKPWNPIAIACLGALFTPMWGGAMAALNGKRLNTSVSAWLPLFIGFGFIAIDIVVSLVIDMFWLDLGLYLGTLAALWYFVLSDQNIAYNDIGSHGPIATGGWLYPCLAGTPLALLLLLVLVGALLPLEPRDVCERFSQATTQAEMGRYTTNNLLPALETLAKLEQNGDSGNFELTSEEPVVGGYFVGCRMIFKEGGQYIQIEGIFHLVQYGKEWKIEDLYFTSSNRQPLDPWISVARDYQRIFQTANQLQPEPNHWRVPVFGLRIPLPKAVQGNVAAKNAPKTSWNWSKIGKGAGIVLLAIGAFFKWILGLFSKESQKAGSKT